MSGFRDAELALAALDRRAFLRLLGGVAAAGLAPTGCGGATAPLRPPADARLRALSERGYAVLTAAAARLVGGEGGTLILEGKARPALEADAWLAGTPALATVLSHGLLLLEFGFFPLLPKLRPFTALPPDGQDRLLASLMRSSAGWKRDLFRGLKSLTAATFYAAPVARPLLHYPGPFGSGGGVDVAIAEAMTYDPER